MDETAARELIAKLTYEEKLKLYKLLSALTGGEA